MQDSSIPQPPSSRSTRLLSSVLESVGNTPLVRITKLVACSRVHVLAKLEGVSLAGSIKDRTAKSILERAMEQGIIGPDTTIVESSSGNMGVGLAQACAYYGLRFICVVDPKANPHTIRLIAAYGAEVEMVSEPDPQTGEFLPARIDRVKQLLRSIPRSFWTNQYANLANPHAHRVTMQEIMEQSEGRVDYLFCAVSTCGTLRGCTEYIRANNLPTKVVAVDVNGSRVFSDTPAPRRIPGIGAGIKPEHSHVPVDHVVHVSDIECILSCRRLVQAEGILAGGSSGAVVAALERMVDQLEPGVTCALVFPDRGERYLDTIYSDDWVLRHFSDELPPIWRERKRA